MPQWTLTCPEIATALREVLSATAIRAIVPLSGGIDFETYRVTLAGESVHHIIVKAAPVPFRMFSSYDGWVDYGHLVEREWAFCRVASAEGLPVPRVLGGDTSPATIGRPFLIADFLPGLSLEVLYPALEDRQRGAISTALGTLVAKVHSIKAPRWGPLDTQEPVSWSDFFVARLACRLTWARRYGVVTEAEACCSLDAARALIRQSGVPALLHMDIRRANVLAEPSPKPALCGLVDASNALGGDPAYDLARAEAFGATDEAFWRGYEEVRPGPLREGKAYLLYRLESEVLLLAVLREEIRNRELSTLQEQTVKRTLGTIVGSNKLGG